jgi:methyl coenzyme M reductase gamma subunit
MAIIGIPLVNGVEYTHADIIVNILGIPVIGVTAINYSDMQDITGNHATGQHYTSVGFGAFNPQGSVTMTMKEVQRLSNAAPNGRIQNIPFFDIGVVFATEAGDFLRHRLIKCKFKGRNPDSSVNNSQIEETLELFISDINYNAK